MSWSRLDTDKEQGHSQIGVRGSGQLAILQNFWIPRPDGLTTVCIDKKVIFRKLFY